MNHKKLNDGFKEGYEMTNFEGNPDYWNGKSDKNGYTEGKWLAHDHCQSSQSASHNILLPYHIVDN